MSESPEKAIFKSPISAIDVGGDNAFGRLVAAASLSGQPVSVFAEQALVKSMMADFGVAEHVARELLSALESSERPT